MAEQRDIKYVAREFTDFRHHLDTSGFLTPSIPTKNSPHLCPYTPQGSQRS